MAKKATNNKNVKQGRAPAPAKKKGAPKPRQARRGGAPSGHPMSPLHPAVVPVALKSGTAFPYTGMVRAAVTVSNARVLVAVTNTGNSGTCMTTWVVSNGALALETSMYTIPTLALADDAGGPTAGRAMKAGISIVNTTQLFNRGGQVYVLNGSSRIRFGSAPSTMSKNEMRSVMNEIIAMPETRSYDGTHFGETRELSCCVADNVSYSDFTWWSGTETLDDYMAHLAIWPGATPKVRPMSTTWLVFDPPAVDQTYSFTTRASYYTRWSVDSIPGQSQKEIPVAPIATVNRLHGIAEKFAGTLHTAEAVGIGSLVTTYGPRIASGLRALGAGAAAMAPGMELVPLLL